MTNSIIKRILSAIVGYFLKGLIFIAPIVLTFYIIKWLFESLDKILPMTIPGLGILIILISVTIIGYLGSKLISQPLFNWFEGLIGKTPGIKFIYSSIKDMLEAFVGDKKKFKEPVLVKMNETGLMKIGFITSKDLKILSKNELDGEFLGVYFPHSYNFSGNHFIVNKKNIIPIKANSTEIMKYVVSGGVTEIN
ncbi:MAG: DUF502 domain-containing protein [Bacteroidetes bacterium]|nr:DUF502 domain-containing protein [Bacteroidota bacterium]